MSQKASQRPRRRPAGATPPAGSSYVYPFYKADATVGRVDQGQDFGGKGPILAIGNAKIISIGAPGWPGGGGILYQLLDGPKAGHYVYTYEGVQPTVRAGQEVRAGQTIGRIIPGTSTGIETGWANAQGVPLSHAEYHEGLETKAGKSFARFLEGLGHSDVTGSPAATRKAEEEAKHENLGESVIPGGGEIAGEVLGGLAGLLSGSAESLMLNIGLIGGGAFLVYYGTALLAGVQDPTLKLARAGKKTAEVVAAVAPK